MEKISIKQFCEFVGLSTNDKFVLLKKYPTSFFTLKEWQTMLKGEFQFDSSRITLLILSEIKEAKNKVKEVS